jgi:hypothetical protein
MRVRTGELEGRPTGSFGVVAGKRARPGEVYGFFGQGLPLLTAPFVGLGDLLHRLAPHDWRHAPRSDLHKYAEPSARGDLRRMAVVWSTCLITALAALALAFWLLALGLSPSAAVFASVAYALGSAAWPYASTYLSEPLSALCLCACLWQAQMYRNAEAGSSTAKRALLLAALAAAFSLHVHILNLLALPFLIAYVALPAKRSRRLSAEARLWGTALGLGALSMLLLGASQWWRFGSAFATGRFDHYAHWVLPFEGLAAFAIAPGRSLFIYAPVLLFGLWAIKSSRERFGLEMSCVLGLLLLRATFAASRSDWSGGWSLGPRYLVPVLPLLMLPAALAWEEGSALRRRRFTLALVALMALQAWLAAHAVGEHMLVLSNTQGVDDYGHLSHWSPSSSPFVGFWSIDARLRAAVWEGDLVQIMAVARLDMLSFGALRLALTGKGVSLLVITGLCALASVTAGLSLLRWPPRSTAISLGSENARSTLAPDSQS